MAAYYRNIHEIKVELLQILDELVLDIMMDGFYEDNNYNIYTAVISLLSVIEENAMSSGDALSPESEPVVSTAVPEDAPLDTEDDDVRQFTWVVIAFLELGPVPFQFPRTARSRVQRDVEDEIKPAQGKEEPADNGVVV